MTLQDLDIHGKRVLMRVDFNVPLSPEGEITDLSRIKACLPSICYILEQGGSVILMSHLGRPEGKKEARYSLTPCAKALASLIGQEVKMAPDCIGPPTEHLAKNLKSKEILLLENLRFHAAEEKPSLDPSFAKLLSAMGDVYVNDAFGCCHRAHSSICPITTYFPNKAASGLLLQKEILFLNQLLHSPAKPFYVLIGGAKVSSKIGTLQKLATKADALFIGGAMAFTFLKALGKSIGSSPYEEESLAFAKDFLTQTIYLPEDIVITDNLKKPTQIHTVTVEEGIPEGWQGVDIGPRTLQTWLPLMQKCKTFFWNGPVGLFEISPFNRGTEAVAECMASVKGAVTVIGGGDSVAAITQMGLSGHFSHLSTGGGASLEFLEKGHLPGINALSEK